MATLRDVDRRSAKAVLAMAAALSSLLIGTPASFADPAPAPVTRTLPLPQPVYDVAALPGIGLRADRLATSKVPGPTATDEQVAVAVSPDGTPASVTVIEHIVVNGTGDYVIRQRGPARRAEAIGDTVPPVVKLGTVLWQGFSPGRRELAARLVLDAALEAPRLPLAVSLTFRGRDGQMRPLGLGAVTPGAGTVVITLTNETTAPVPVAMGIANPIAAGAVLDLLRTRAIRTGSAPPPAPGRGLPAYVPGRKTGDIALQVTAPLRVTGTIRCNPPAPVTGPGTSADSDGASVAGTLAGSVSWSVAVAGKTRLGFDLTAVPALDPRTLVPPGKAVSWSAWARSAAPAAVTTALLEHTATATRAAEFVGYLSLDAATSATTSYHFTVAPAPAAVRAAAATSPDPVGIGAAAVALLAIVANALALRRVL